MEYINYYKSPLGQIVLSADDVGLTGLWFAEQQNLSSKINEGSIIKELPIFKETKRWLDIYFSGTEPEFTPNFHQTGTDFRMSVWEVLRTIPYGKTVTYKDIAETISKRKGLTKMSAQAIGGAVGHNKILIIVPCHRVIGTSGNLTGYAGGLERKIKLLHMEKEAHGNCE